MKWSHQPCLCQGCKISDAISHKPPWHMPHRSGHELQSLSSKGSNWAFQRFILGNLKLLRRWISSSGHHSLQWNTTHDEVGIFWRPTVTWVLNGSGDNSNWQASGVQESAQCTIYYLSFQNTDFFWKLLVKFQLPHFSTTFWCIPRPRCFLQNSDVPEP